jgi:hypothetical protein
LTSDQPVGAAAGAKVCFLVARITPRRGRERRLWVGSGGSIVVWQRSGIGATLPLARASAKDR